MKDSGLKLFMVLLGANPPGRNVEQHDYFFGIAAGIKDLVPQMKAFWPEAGKSLHIDGWREVTAVDGYAIQVAEKDKLGTPAQKKLFFINLGGYQSGKLEEQHFIVLTLQDDRLHAVKDAKKTVFFKTNTIVGGHSHIDEKFGIDVDDIHKVEDILAAELKEKYSLIITPVNGLPNDDINLGYFKLDKL